VHEKISDMGYLVFNNESTILHAEYDHEIEEIKKRFGRWTGYDHEIEEIRAYVDSARYREALDRLKVLTIDKCSTILTYRICCVCS